MAAERGQATAPFSFPPSRQAAVAALLLPLAVLAFLPGIEGPFILDDVSNLTNAPAFLAASSDCANLDPLLLTTESGPLGRPVAMLSFAIDHCLHGL